MINCFFFFCLFVCFLTVPPPCSRTALARFTFAKYATAFFQARQVPTFSNESITKPLSAALAKRSDLTALAIDAFGCT